MTASAWLPPQTREGLEWRLLGMLPGTGPLGCCGASWAALQMWVRWLLPFCTRVLIRPRVALPSACSAYLHTGEEMLPHGAAMPARERSTLFDQPVAVAGRGVAAATQAAPPGAGGAMLPRCPASLRLCEGRPHWSCRACGRRYLQPQGACSEAAGSEPTAPLPACVFCGLPLGSAGPAVLFSPPCCS